MFRLQVERVVSAAHAIEINGEREAVHGHDWRVRVRVEGPRLDGDGLLCDFHALELDLDEVLAPFHNMNLNSVPPFDEVNPTAERFAEHIAMCMLDRLPPGILSLETSVTEAPGCEATVSLEVTAAQEQAQ
jgi:6-pyruvoyltetrahydropterin/6-carboxytetrahydropterin synthase